MKKALIFASEPNASFWKTQLKEDRELLLDSLVFSTISQGFNAIANEPAEIIIVQAMIDFGFSEEEIRKMRLHKCECSGLYVAELIAEGYGGKNEKTPILYTTLTSPDKCPLIIGAVSERTNTHLYYELSGKEITSVVKEIIRR